MARRSLPTGAPAPRVGERRFGLCDVCAFIADLSGAALDAVMGPIVGAPSRVVGTSQVSRALLDVQLEPTAQPPRALVHRGRSAGHKTGRVRGRSPSVDPLARLAAGYPVHTGTGQLPFARGTERCVVRRHREGCAHDESMSCHVASQWLSYGVLRVATESPYRSPDAASPSMLGLFWLQNSSSTGVSPVAEP
jgi:hypothetical protein